MFIYWGLGKLFWLVNELTWIKKKFILIGGLLLYNIVMASAIHQHESPIGIHVTPSSWTPLLPPCPSHPPRWSWNTSSGFFASYTKLPLALYFTYYSLKPFHPLLLPLCPKVCSLCLWYIYTMKYYSALKKNAFESVLMRWMNIKPIIQSEVSQKEKQISYINAYIWNPGR